jgi:hypothetical protein
MPFFNRLISSGSPNLDGALLDIKSSLTFGSDDGLSEVSTEEEIARFELCFFFFAVLNSFLTCLQVSCFQRQGCEYKK